MPEGVSTWDADGGEQPSMYKIAFSDGASSASAQGWAAFSAIRAAQGRTIVSATAWRGPPGGTTVPALEAAGIEAAVELLSSRISPRHCSRRVPREAITQAQGLLRQAWPASWPT